MINVMGVTNLINYGDSLLNILFSWWNQVPSAPARFSVNLSRVGVVSALFLPCVAPVSCVGEGKVSKRRFRNMIAFTIGRMKRDDIVHLLQTRLTGLLGIYVFGSRANGTAGSESDLDLAVLVAGYVEPLLLWDLASEIADLAGCPVDLLDLRAASTVMQYQVISQGDRWWESDAQAALYEVAILSEKTALDTARAELLEDIQQRGSVYD